MSTEIDNDTSIDNESNIVSEPTAASGFGNPSLDADKIDDSTEARIDALLDESIRDTAPDFKEDDSSGEEDAQNLIAAETPKIERDSRSVEASSQTNQVEATPVAEIDPEIAAIEQPSAGQVRVGGQDISRLTPGAVPFLRRNIGLTFQDQKLLFDRSVLDNVVLPLLYLGTLHKEAQSRARAALDKVGIREKERLFPAMLSGGEQQRVAIARAIVGRPAILLADEPTANLDDKTAQRIVDIFADFQRIGVTVMIATHDPELLRGKATRAITLGAGQLVSDTELSLTQGGA
jgi:cell division transport system ATP-binding protein